MLFSELGYSLILKLPLTLSKYQWAGSSFVWKVGFKTPSPLTSGAVSQHARKSDKLLLCRGAGHRARGGIPRAALSGKHSSHPPLPDVQYVAAGST